MVAGWLHREGWLGNGAGSEGDGSRGGSGKGVRVTALRCIAPESPRQKKGPVTRALARLIEAVKAKANNRPEWVELLTSVLVRLGHAVELVGPHRTATLIEHDSLN